MARKITIAIVLLLCLSGCSTHKGVSYGDDYVRFLTFAENFPVSIHAMGCCSDLEAAQVRGLMYQRRMAYLQEAKMHKVLRANIYAALWLWLEKMRDRGSMSTEQFVYFSRQLLAWKE